MITLQEVFKGLFVPMIAGMVPVLYLVWWRIVRQKWQSGVRGGLMLFRIGLAVGITGIFYESTLYGYIRWVPESGYGDVWWLVLPPKLGYCALAACVIGASFDDRVVGRAAAWIAAAFLGLWVFGIAIQQ